MASKTNFNSDEWAKILQGVMMGGIAVSTAEPSGVWGTLKESFASGRALLEAKTDAGSSELIKAVIADFETSEGRTIVRDGLQAQLTGTKPEEVKSKAIDSLREVSALLDAKAPAEAAPFKAWLRQISQRVAEAAKEGSVLGFGGRSGQRRREGDPDRNVERIGLEGLSGGTQRNGQDNTVKQGQFECRPRRREARPHHNRLRSTTSMMCDVAASTKRD
jgi:hypothetical protein